MSSFAATMSPSSDKSSARPERVLYVRAASFPRRFLAAAFDVLLVGALALAVTAGAAFLLGLPMPRLEEMGPDLLVAGLLDRSPLAAGGVGVFLGLGGLYQIYLGGITGQTLGKRLLGIRVISGRGSAPGPLGGILRFLALLLCLAPAGLGWLWALFDKERRAVHDRLAGTYVIVEER